MHAETARSHHNKKCFYFTLFFTFIFFNSSLAKAQDILYVGIGSSPINKSIYPPLFKKFEQETKIKVITTRLDDIKRLDNNKAWYTSHEEPLDLIFGQLSQRLHKFYLQGKLRSLNEFWQKNDLDKSLGHLKQMSTYDGQILGIPYKLFSWQIFYMPSVLGKDFTPPKTLNELLPTCKRLNNAGITAFHIAEKSSYIQMAWFEYLTLRTYGLDYFYQLMQGKQSYRDDKIHHILTIWKELIDEGCFSNRYGKTSWKDNLQFFFNKKNAFLFVGLNLSTYKKSTEIADKIKFFAFPKISEIPRYESVPVNAIHLSALSKKKEQSFKLLEFLSRADVQEKLNHKARTMPANKFSKPPSDKYSQQLAKTIVEAAGTSAFIDRVVLPSFELESRPYFNSFVKTGDIDSLKKNLEKLRLKHYQ